METRIIKPSSYHLEVDRQEKESRSVLDADLNRIRDHRKRSSSSSSTTNNIQGSVFENDDNQVVTTSEKDQTEVFPPTPKQEQKGPAAVKAQVVMETSCNSSNDVSDMHHAS